MPTSLWLKRLAIPIADKLVYASSAYVDLKSTQNSMAHLLMNFQNDPAGPSDRRLSEFALRIRPWTSEELRLVRVGGGTDGGYIMAEDFEVGGAISIGVGRDVSWDRDIAERGIRVVMFDPTIRRPPSRIRGAKFFRVGLGAKQSKRLYRSLPELLRLAEFHPSEELLLKVDIEGDEWDVFAGLSAHDLKPFRQIVIEFHGIKALRSERASRSLFQALDSICENHLAIHAHANNYDEIVRFDLNWFANAVEVTFARRDILVNPKPARVIRADLDRPCDPRVTEISLAPLTDLPVTD